MEPDPKTHHQRPDGQNLGGFYLRKQGPREPFREPIFDS
jgi:hypothetical protein